MRTLATRLPSMGTGISVSVAPMVEGGAPPAVLNTDSQAEADRMRRRSQVEETVQASLHRKGRSPQDGLVSARILTSVTLSV